MPVQGRPHRLEELLSEPIPTYCEGAILGHSYPGWEYDHCHKARFYVQGFLGFLRLQVVKDTKQLFSKYADEALDVAARETTWIGAPGPSNVWDELSSNQFRAARNGKAMYWQKAALVILACELAVAAAMSKGRIVRGLSYPAEVYSFLKIVPACFNVDGFNARYLDVLLDAHPGATNPIALATRQSKSILEDLTAGYTVTRRTAYAIVNHIAGNYPDHPVGPVRGKPGRKLGVKSASENETLDLG
jgi:hypothetical protein